MNIQVRYHFFTGLATKKNSETIALNEGGTIQDLIDRLLQIYGRPLKEVLLDTKGQLTEFQTIFVNGISFLNLKSTHTILKNGDKVAFSQF